MLTEVVSDDIAIIKLLYLMKKCEILDNYVNLIGEDI